MFSTYPDEWPGAGLLLLRVATGTVLMVRCVFFLAGWHDLNLAAVVTALLALGGAILLLTGYFTRVGGTLVALTSVFGIIDWSPVPNMNVLESRLTAALLAVIAGALVCLGPGAFSLDARLFGRQEIIFPKTASDK